MIDGDVDRPKTAVQDSGTHRNQSRPATAASNAVRPPTAAKSSPTPVAVSFPPTTAPSDSPQSLKRLNSNESVTIPTSGDELSPRPFAQVNNRPGTAATIKRQSSAGQRPLTAMSKHHSITAANNGEIVRNDISAAISDHLAQHQNHQNITVGPVYILQTPAGVKSPPPAYQENRPQTSVKERVPSAKPPMSAGPKVAATPTAITPKPFAQPSKPTEEPKGNKAEKGKKDMKNLKKEVDMVSEILN